MHSSQSLVETVVGTVVLAVADAFVVVGDRRAASELAVAAVAAKTNAVQLPLMTVAGVPPMAFEVAASVVAASVVAIDAAAAATAIAAHLPALAGDDLVAPAAAIDVVLSLADLERCSPMDCRKLTR